MTAWDTQQSELLLQNPWIKIYKDTVTLPTGKDGEYTYVENLPFVLVVAATPQGLLMVRQFRYTIQQTTLEFPAGSIETDEPPLIAAKRELQQETGFSADRWTRLGIIHESLSTNKTHGEVFLAETLNRTDHNEMAEEGIEKYIILSPQEITHKITAGNITDTKTIAAFFLATKHLS